MHMTLSQVSKLLPIGRFSTRAVTENFSEEVFQYVNLKLIFIQNNVHAIGKVSYIILFKYWYRMGLRLHIYIYICRRKPIRYQYLKRIMYDTFPIAWTLFCIKISFKLTYWKTSSEKFSVTALVENLPIGSNLLTCDSVICI